MPAPTPKPSTFPSIIEQWAKDGIGIVIAILFFIIIIIIVLVATASAKAWWDTVIASLAMTSQAFFAYVVWRLGQAQYAFTRQVADRQHRIEMFPLRKAAANNLENAGQHIKPFGKIFYSQISEFLKCKHEIGQLFSSEAASLAHNLCDALEEALYLFGKANRVYDPMLGKSVPIHPEMETQAGVRMEQASEILGDLQRKLNDEMRIT